MGVYNKKLWSSKCFKNRQMFSSVVKDLLRTIAVEIPA
jgi:hypothetical protein